MNFTVNTIVQSLADYLLPLFPGVTFIQNPTQQNSGQNGVNVPCMFLQQRYSYITLQTGGYYYRRIGLDLTYLVDYNLTNLQELYQTAAEMLDLNMETFPYNDGTTTGTVQLRTYDREWRIDLDALHYKFELRERVTIPETETKMQTIQELNEEVTINEK